MKYNVKIPKRNGPVTNSEIMGFINQELNRVLNALKDANREEVRRLSLGLVSILNKILDQIREKKESEARQRIANRRRASDGNDEEEYDTSEPEQSKHHEDAEEIKEEGATCDITFEEDFIAMDDLETLERLANMDIEKAIEKVAKIRSKYFN